MEINNFIFTSDKRRKTTLDKAYKNHITKIIGTLDDEKEGRWETYNIIIQELLNDGKEDYFDEIKYRITDGENPSEVILDVINRDVDSMNGLVWLLKRRLEEYIEDDYFKRFF